MAMRCDIRHVTRYEFSDPVNLDQHLLRLRPRCAGAQFVERFELVIEPAPKGKTDHVDAEGNSVTRVWFEEPTEYLQTSTRASVVLRRTDPYDFLLNETNSAIPVAYLPNVQPLLIAARQRSSLPARSDPVRELAETTAVASEHHVTRFLSSLAKQISDNWETVHRDTGAPWRPEQTFERKSGACRDLAWLYVDACRAIGLAARFVSGYQQGTVDQDRRELHAWAEVYLPGGGWRGFDPTSGFALADRHAAVAASVTPSGASCVEGTFRPASRVGEARSTLTTEIEVTFSEENSHQFT
jgi:transglutaminase-like putative cysteine protease